MSVFAIADLHLSMADNIDKPMDMFGKAWVGHAERLKKNWEAMIGPEDTVIVPGDISWALKLEDAIADLAWVDQLPGTKLLLRGNHDLWWASMAKMRGLFSSICFLKNDCYVGDGFAVFGSRGWTCPGARDFSESEDRKIYNREIIRMDLALDALNAAKKRAAEEGRELTVIGAMHYPPTNEKKQPSDFTERFSAAGAKLVVYGHLHGEHSFYNGPLGMMDGVEYRLCSLDRLDCVPMRIL